MARYEIFIAYVSWGSGGKTRPVLVWAHGEEYVTVYQITSQYAKKSEAVRAKYFPVADWKISGLDRPSYVDTNDTYELPNSVIAGKKPVGRLTRNDKRRLIAFLKAQ